MAVILSSHLMAIAAATAEAPLEPADGVRRGPPPPSAWSGSPSGLVLTAIALFSEMGSPPAMELCEHKEAKWLKGDGKSFRNLHWCSKLKGDDLVLKE